MILVFGNTGLLGSHICALYPSDTIGFNSKTCNLLDKTSVIKTIVKYKPEVVINAAGVTNKLGKNFSCNVVGPRYIAEACNMIGARLIHISTDYVFSGKVGNYSEADFPDCNDIYGLSKFAGEIFYEPHITIRTSFVGYPDPKNRGLLAWLFSNTGDYKPGYVNVLWNGLSTTILADWIFNVLLNSKIYGLVHVYNQTISKYNLLKIVNKIFNLNKVILPNESVVSNRTLTSIRADIVQPKLSVEDCIYDLVSKQTIINKYLKNLL